MISAMKTILTAVIGAVGPDICVDVPPNKAAKKLKKIAPYNPALGPRPELTPKAKANGSATIPAVNPPKRSPLKCLKSKLKILFIIYFIIFDKFYNLINTTEIF
jgi:hypothetical protein